MAHLNSLPLHHVSFSVFVSFVDAAFLFVPSFLLQYKCPEWLIFVPVTISLSWIYLHSFSSCFRVEHLVLLFTPSRSISCRTSSCEQVFTPLFHVQLEHFSPMVDLPFDRSCHMTSSHLTSPQFTTKPNRFCLQFHHSSTPCICSLLRHDSPERPLCSTFSAG